MRSADRLIALKRGGELAFFFAGFALHQLLLGEHALVVGSVGDLADHRAGPALARLVHQRAQFLFPVGQRLPSRHQVVAMIFLVLARIDHPGARAVAEAAAGERQASDNAGDNGGGAKQKAAARSRAVSMAQCKNWFRDDPLLSPAPTRYATTRVRPPRDYNVFCLQCGAPQIRQRFEPKPARRPGPSYSAAWEADIGNSTPALNPLRQTSRQWRRASPWLVSNRMKRSGSSHSFASTIRAPVSEISAIAQRCGNDAPSSKTLAL